MADERVTALQAEVAVLQRKLDQLHATDVNTLRRGYTTVAQHVHALKLEAERLEALVQELEPEIYDARFVAEELGKAAAVSGASWVLYTLMKTITPLPAKAGSLLRSSLLAATLAVVTWRFASSSIGRFASAFLDHRRRRRAFLKELSELNERIAMLHALTRSMPGVRLDLASASQSSLSGAGGSGGNGGNGGNGGGGTFVLVDMPRVESGGFSPAATPPPGAEAVAQQQQQLGGRGGGGAPPGLPAGPTLPAPQRAVSGSAGTSGAGGARPQQLPGATQQELALLQQPAAEQAAAAGGWQPRSSPGSDGGGDAARRSAFQSASMSGWGGVLMRQQRSLQRGSDEGEAAAAARGGAAQVSPASSEEAVLLERE